MEVFFDWFRWLYQETGINLTYIYDSYDRTRLLKGFWTTVLLASVCLFFSVIIGIVGAWLQGSRLKWTRRIVQGYIQFFRNTPPLVQLYFAGSFNVEIFRSGIEAVPKSTIEAAESLGYTRLKAYIHIVLPLAFRVCLPALNNNLVNLVKTTTLAFAIAVPEMLYVSSQIWSDNVNVREVMTFLLVAYIALVGILVWAMNRWERAMKIPGYGGQ